MIIVIQLQLTVLPHKLIFLFQKFCLKFQDTARFFYTNKMLVLVNTSIYTRKTLILVKFKYFCKDPSDSQDKDHSPPSGLLIGHP